MTHLQTASTMCAGTPMWPASRLKASSSSVGAAPLPASPAVEQGTVQRTPGARDGDIRPRREGCDGMMGQEGIHGTGKPRLHPWPWPWQAERDGVRKKRDLSCPPSFALWQDILSTSG